MNFSDLYTLISSNSYLILFILLVVEGPIITVIASFLASLEYFNVYLVFLLAILGDLITDIVLFYLGRANKKGFFKKRIKKNHIGKKQIEKIKTLLHEHPFKALFLVKITPGIAPVGLVLAGASKMKTSLFLSYTILISSINKVIYASLGFFAGVSVLYLIRNFDYIEYVIPLFIIFIVLVVYGIVKIKKSLSSELK